ncbi:TAP42 family protein [Babesia ovata]|uniref:TAP42 family protein n=1 Tax=Babesia ovata TaxID=189622 RepID=A0A2H6KGH8_9APIC|nr:TAP42 family protein [Babesia ovata]GBE62103.1 TAP42 family protein [Babesia ovata]
MEGYADKSEMDALNDLFAKAFAQYFMMLWCHRGYETFSPFPKELEAVVSFWPNNIPSQHEEPAEQETISKDGSNPPGQATRDGDRLRKLKALKDLEYAFQLMMVGCHEMNLFSSNEEIADVHTEDLKFLMLPYLAAHVGIEKPDIKQRLNVLKRCVVYLTEFINTLIRMNIMHQRELVYWERNLGDIADERRTFRINSTKYSIEILAKLRPAFNTAEGIATFIKSANANHSDEATVRARILDLLHLFSFEAINLYDMIKMEIPLLERHLRESSNPELNASREDGRMEPPRSKPWVVKVDGVSKLDPTTAHFLYKKLIFVPGHNLPNISLEECARIEMDMDVNTIGVRGAKENKKKEDSAEEDDGCKSGSESSSSSDSDEDSDDTKEKATWDDWKDDHPRGSGNKNRNVG